MKATANNRGDGNGRSTEKADTRSVSVAVPGVSIERPGLYIIATPIGNLGDFTARAAAVLQNVDQVFSEDTRVSRRLFEHYAITAPLVAYHEHNEKRLADKIVERLIRVPEACALISDAGTPLISDPGFVLVRRAIDAGVPVFTVPGPCALAAALSISGLPTDRFVFEGFLPAQAGAREKRLISLRRETRTMVFYEAPHRLLKTLEVMQEVFGEAREAVVARELTKRHETVYRGQLLELCQRIRSLANASRGEIVILVAGAQAAHDPRDVERVLDAVLPLTDRRTAIQIAVALTGRGRNEIYQRVLKWDSQGAGSGEPDPD